MLQQKGSNGSNIFKYDKFDYDVFDGFSSILTPSLPVFILHPVWWAVGGWFECPRREKARERGPCGGTFLTFPGASTEICLRKIVATVTWSPMDAMALCVKLA